MELYCHAIEMEAWTLGKLVMPSFKDPGARYVCMERSLGKNPNPNNCVSRESDYSRTNSGDTAKAVNQLPPKLCWRWREPVYALQKLLMIVEGDTFLVVQLLKRPDVDHLTNLVEHLQLGRSSSSEPPPSLVPDIG
ncbi:hypothetical protein V6N11_009171 [Hibiscus sabdariffa]|uniref:Uncharacterized protein n=1 Tax=Hibiscus sabdariffa TaxID=183260 RepID=A0ABR2PPU8_9ROSI